MTSSDKVKLFGTDQNGQFEFRSLTNADVEESLKLLRESFFTAESVCIGTEINLNYPEAIQARKELEDFSRIIINDGVSLVAAHVATKKIVGVALNKIQYRPRSNEEPFFVDFMNNHCTSLNAKALMQYMITMDEKIDVFKLYGIDCLMEITFLYTHSDFAKQHIGRTLCKYSIELAKNLLNRADADLQNENLKDKRPQAVAALFTSSFSQKIGDALGFKVLNKVPFTEYTFKGKTFSERIGQKHPFSTQTAIKL